MNDELYHHGVKGMKWGVRKEKIASKGDAAPKDAGSKGVRTHIGKGGVTRTYTRDIYKKSLTLNGKTASERRRAANPTKAAYKDAKKAYNKSFSKAYDYSNRHPISQFATKKGKAKSEALWKTAYDDAKKLNRAKDAYKTAKNERKTAIKDVYKTMNKNASIGEKLLYNDATRKRAAKYVVDNDMSYTEASKKAKNKAKRNAAIFMGIYGAAVVSKLAVNTKNKYGSVHNAMNGVKYL